MKIKLTKEQLKEIEKEKIKEEARLEAIPKRGHGWDRIDCQDSIYTLTELLRDKEISVYGN